MSITLFVDMEEACYNLLHDVPGLRLGDRKGPRAEKVLGQARFEPLHNNDFVPFSVWNFLVLFILFIYLFLKENAQYIFFVSVHLQ